MRHSMPGTRYSRPTLTVIALLASLSLAGCGGGGGGGGGGNKAPVANASAQRTEEDTALRITLNGSDEDGDRLIFSIVSGPSLGRLGPVASLGADSASVTYTPDPDVNGDDTIEFQVDDGNGATATAIVRITIDEVADAVRALDDAVATDEDTPAAFTVLDNDLDPDAGDTIAFVSSDAAGVLGLLTDNGDGSYSFDPAAAFQDLAAGESRDTTFTYTIDSSDGSSAEATVTITVSGVNDAPSAAGDRFGVPNLLVNGDFEAGDLSGWSTDTTSAAGFYAVDDDNLLASGRQVAGPASGTYYAVSDQSFVSATVLSQSFTVPLQTPSVAARFDMFVQSQQTTIVNPAGLVIDQGANQQARVDLLSDPVADPFDTAAALVRNLYTVADALPAPAPPDPPHRPFGFDLSGDLLPGMSYQLRFGVAVTSAPLHQGLDNVRVSAGTDEATAIAVPAPGLLGNDSDPDTSDLLSVSGFDPLSAAGAAVVVNADGSYSYDPSASATLALLDRGDMQLDTFSYTVDDGNGGSQTAIAEIVVNGLTNTPPTADPQSVITPEDTALEIVLTGADADGDALTFSIVTPPANGSLGAITPIDASSARVTYTPNADSNGADSFEFQVAERLFTATATVDIDVTALNDPPSALGLDNASIAENQAPGSAVGAFASTDIDSAVFTYSLVAGAGDTDNGAFAIVGDMLQSAASFDFEMQSAYSIRVRTDDGDGGEFEQTFAIAVTDANDPPTALDERFGLAIGNTLLAVGVAVAGEPVVPLAGSVLDNDSDQDGNAVFVATTGALVSANGGSVEMNADGTFTYLPAVGFAGTGVAADTFTYTVSDGTLTSDAVANIDVGFMVWYFDDSSAAGGDGRSRSPLQDLPGTAVIGGVGEYLFVYAGTQTSGATLANAQSLIGEGTGLVVNGVTLVTPGARPLIANPGGVAVTLGQSNLVAGLDINSRSGIVGSNAGSVTIQEAAITTTNGPAVDISGSVSVDLDLDRVDALNNVAGGEAMALVNNGGGSLTITGTTNLQAPAGRALRIENAGVLGSVFAFAGPSVLAGQQGALLLNNPGAEFLFAGLDVDASLGTGLDVRNSGTLTLSGVANTVDVANAGASGYGVRIDDTTLGDPGNGAMTFARISSSGGSGGIALGTTLNLARFVVTGTAATAESGGVLAASSGDGVALNNITGGVSLSNVAVRDHAGNGIRGSNVNGLLLAGSTVENNADAADEAGLLFDELFGTVDISDSTVSGSYASNLVIRNTAATLDLTVSASDIGNNSAANGEDGLFVEASLNAIANLILNNVNFDANRGDDLQAATLGNATLDLTLTGGSMTGAAGKLGSGINLSGDGGVTFDIDSVLITGTGTSAININQASTSDAGDLFSGSVNNATIGTAGLADSGSATGSGVRAIGNGDGTLTIAVSNNTIRQYNDNGIEIIGRDGNGVVNATITSNVLAEPAAFAADGLQVQAGATATDAGTVCAAIGGAGQENTLAGAGGAFDEDFRLRQRFGTTVRLPGYAGANDDTAAVVTFVQGNNTGTPTGSATEDALTGGGFIGTGTACP